MADYEPDSTTQVPVTNDLVNLGDDTNEAQPAPTTYIQHSVEELKKTEKVASTASTPTPSECTTTDSGCPMCQFIGYLGDVTPQPAYDIFVWKDVYKTAVIFFTILPLLVLYTYCSPIVVTAYLLLGLVTTTFSYRMYRYVIDSFQKSDVQNPFLGYNDLEVGNTRQALMEWLDVALPHFVRCFNKLKHYVLVYSVVDTAKFMVLLYVTAVVGGLFSLRLLILLSFVGAFTLPKVYTIYRVQINDTLEKSHKVVQAHLKELKQKVKQIKLSDFTAKLKKQ